MGRESVFEKYTGWKTDCLNSDNNLYSWRTNRTFVYSAKGDRLV